MKNLFIVFVLVMGWVSCHLPDTELDICGAGQFFGHDVGFNLRTVGPRTTECCCSVNIDAANETQCLLVDVFLEYDCSMTLKESESFATNVTCGSRGTWNASCFSPRFKVCVAHNGEPEHLNLGTLRFRSTSDNETVILQCPHSLGLHEDTPQHAAYLVPLIVTIVVVILAVVLVFILIVCFQRQRRKKKCPIDNADTHRADSLFGDEDEGVAVQDNPIFMRNGPDNSGYYRVTKGTKVSTKTRVPTKQPLRVDYAKDKSNTSTPRISIIGNNNIENTNANREEATFTY